MPQAIDRDAVRRLADQGAQLVEVLPANEYAEDHLPGAINLPLRRLEQQARRSWTGIERWSSTAGTPPET
jgi:rhodanese-related sulfurtransferase